MNPGSHKLGSYHSTIKSFCYILFILYICFFNLRLSVRTSLSSWLHSRKVDCRDSARFWPGVINPRHLCPYQCGGSKSDSNRIRILPELKNLQVLKHCNFFLPKKSRKHENTTFTQLKKTMNNVNKNIKVRNRYRY